MRGFVWKLVLTVVNKGVDSFFDGPRVERPLIFAWTLFYLMIQSVYTSALMTHFIVRPKAPFETMQDLGNKLKSGQLRFIAQNDRNDFLQEIKKDPEQYQLLNAALLLYPPILEPNATVKRENISAVLSLENKLRSCARNTFYGIPDTC